MKDNKKFRSNFIWNMLGTGLNAFNSLFFLIIATRINGMTESGIFSIAFSTACILYVVGIYAGRIFQVTESDKNIKDKEYIINRFISCGIMMVLVILFVVIKQYEWYKATMFILLCTYKGLEAFSDVLYGILQKNNELDKVGKSYFLKSILSIVGFVIVDIITHDLIISSITLIVIWILLILIYDIRAVRRFLKPKEVINKTNIGLIFKNGFFVFAVSFLGLYVLNAPKYAIDSYLTEEMQTVFAIIVMPATVIGLMGQFILHPYLTNILELYEQKKLKELNCVVRKIVGGIAGFGIVSCILAYWLGIPVLNLIYGIDLVAYKWQLVIVIFASTLYNMGVIYSSVLTTIRKTGIQFVAYTIISVIAFIVSSILTQEMEIRGAVIAYFVIMFLYFIIYLGIKTWILKRIERKIENE